jgi:uncharacterized protein YqhQ
VLVRIASRVVFIAPIAALSYEVLRVGGRWGGNAFVHAMFLPNLALQGLTTRVPDDTQIEVAIASFEAVVKADAEKAAELEAAGELAPDFG